MKKLIFALMVLMVSISAIAQVKNERFVVNAVHDGDSYSIKLADGSFEWQRLLYVDAPEVVSNHVKAAQTFGKEAGDYVRGLLKGRTVIVHRYGVDMYDRSLASIWILQGGTASTLKYVRLDSILIRNGYAWYIGGVKGAKIPKSERLKGGSKLMALAKKEGLGIWALKNPVKPAVWRRKNKVKV